MIFSLLKIGLAYRNGEDITRAVLAFCGRFGLLGFEQAVVEKEYDDGSVKFYRDNVLGVKAATKQEYINIFDPFPIERRRNRRRKEIEPMEEIPTTENGEPYILTPNYECCEAVTWYGRYGMQVYELFRRAQAGKQLTLLPGNVEARYELQNGIGQRKVYFDTLKSICDFYILELLTSPAPVVRLCKRCGRPLLTNGTRQEYCSASCRNVANFYRSRRKKQSAKR